MKQFFLLHTGLFLLFMMACHLTQGQDYLVTSKGDTIQGDIKPLSYGAEKKVQVTTSDRKKTVYTIFQTKAFSLKGETYRPVKKQDSYLFMKVLKPGYLTLYAFQMDNQTSYDGLFLLKRDGAALEVPNLTFKKNMMTFLKECSAVTSKIDNGEFNKRSLDKIVDEYNRCIDEKTSEQLNRKVDAQEKTKKISAWDVLEAKVNEKSDFQSKSDALDMIADIKTKIKNGEKVPNFLLEGLKNSLANAELSNELNNAISELKQ